MFICRLQLGELKIKFGITNLDDVNFIERNVTRKVPQQADIVLLELDKKVFFQPSISPICIVQETDDVKGKNERFFNYYSLLFKDDLLWLPKMLKNTFAIFRLC
jgi:hypothetical protein